MGKSDGFFPAQWADIPSFAMAIPSLPMKQNSLERQWQNQGS